MQQESLENSFLDQISQNEGIIHKVINLYVDDSEQRKDVYQEILCQAWKSFSGFKRNSKFSTWLYKVSLNTVLRLKKKDKKVDVLPSTQRDSGVHQDDHEVLFDIIKKMGEIDKMLITLHLDGYKNLEIADITGMTPNHVNVKLHRIKQSIIEDFKKILKMGERNINEAELFKAWKSLEEKKFAYPIDRSKIIEAIRMDALPIVVKMKSGLKSRIYWACGFTILMVLFLIFYVHNIEMVKLFSLNVVIGLIGTSAIYVAYLGISEENRDLSILESLKHNEYQIRKVIKIESIWALSLFGCGLFLRGGLSAVEKGLTISEFIYGPDFLYKFLPALIIGLPLIYLALGILNNKDFGIDLKKLRATIIKMETLT